MALISMRQMLDHAAEFGYGVPAFNVNNLEQMRAIMEAADKTDSPVIVQASAGARKYAGAPFLRHLILAAIEEFPHIPVCMHQDHGTSPDVCQRSIQLGFSSVMMDGQRLSNPRTLSHTGMPRPIQLRTSHAPSSSNALNRPMALSRPMASGMEKTFQKLD
jgi:fructose-bisphosphate aldolase, class II